MPSGGISIVLICFPSTAKSAVFLSNFGSQEVTQATLSLEIMIFFVMAANSCFCKLTTPFWTKALVTFSPWHTLHAVGLNVCPPVLSSLWQATQESFVKAACGDSES